MNQTAIALIGIDGGASKVSGWTIKVSPEGTRFDLGELNIQKAYKDYPEFQPDFIPVAVSKQLEAKAANEIVLTPEEVQQGNVYIRACADAIIELAQKSGTRQVVVGIGMPGLKTNDKRGIDAIANGPRMLEYARRVEDHVAEAGITFAAPIAYLGSDADYCGIGEEYASNGSFHKSTFGYYLGGGTGTADALKLDGKLVPLDQTKPWMAKSWELKNDQELSLERYASASGLQYIYSLKSGFSIEELNEQQMYPPQIAEQALAGDEAAQKTYQDAAKYLARLLYERISTLYCGWQKPFGFVNPNRPELEAQHPYLGSTFDRLIIGQRLSELMASRAGNSVLSRPLIANLSQLIANSDCLSEEAKMHYLHGDSLRGERLYLSPLREAPALGAGIDAYLNWKKN
jgi:predicted NBD/HSP70 family sugar kinase